MNRKIFWVLALVVLVSACGQSSHESGEQVQKDFAEKEYVDSLFAEFKNEMRAVVDDVKRHRASISQKTLLVNKNSVKKQNLVVSHGFEECFVSDDRYEVFVNDIDSIQVKFVGEVSKEKFGSYDGKFSFRDATTQVTFDINGVQRIVVVRHWFSCRYSTYREGSVFPELYWREVKSKGLDEAGNAVVNCSIIFTNGVNKKRVAIVIDIREKPVVD